MVLADASLPTPQQAEMERERLYPNLPEPHKLSAFAVRECA